MRKCIKLTVGMFSVILVLSFINSCSVTTKTINPNATVHYDETYGFSDKKQIVDTLISSLTTKSILAHRADDRPVVIMYGIANRTDEHISTKNISDDLRMGLVQSGKVKLVNETQRKDIATETEYQYGQNVSPETRIARGKQVGAEFMISGTLYSISQKEGREVRLKRKSLKYYSLNLELTSIETGLIEWADKVEIVREASKPIIGW